jgi:flagellar biosynthetic protein FliO
MIYAYLQMAAALALVVGLIFLMGYVLKKKQNMGSGLMKVLAYQSLGPRKGLVAVKVAEDVLLLGVTATDLKLLKAYEQGTFKAEPVDAAVGNLKKLKTLKESLL